MSLIRHLRVLLRSLKGTQIVHSDGPVPDLLAYNETELTRSTLVRILENSSRLGDFFLNPQRFMDAVVSIIRFELHRLLIDGIK